MEFEKNKIYNSFINRFIGKILITLNVLFIIFLCASSIIFSSSIVRICVSSRKLSNPYTIPNPSGFDNVANEYNKKLDCYEKGVYVYELPSKFNKDLVAQCKDMINGLDLCQFLTNDGLGEPILQLGKDWYNTNQYSTELIFHSRILKHPCRVHDPEEAKIFYVPFYGGLDNLRWRFKDVSNEVKDSLSIELVQWLKRQNTWERSYGLDHVFVSGQSSLDFEHHPWNINEVGVPHPTHFHPSSDQDMEEWQSRVRKVQRKNLIGFAGAPYKKFDKIRSILIEQCTSESENTCGFFDCSKNACVNPTPVINLFMESEFCLHPDIDSSATKSLFDSLIAGCIPVVFDSYMVHNGQYPWHLPKDYKRYSVYIDKDEVSTYEVNVIERLGEIPLKKRQQMREYIIEELVPKLVYSNPNATLEKFKDAFDISMIHLLQSLIDKFQGLSNLV